MYKCLECGSIFTEPEFYEPLWKVFGTHTHETCPYCGGPYEEAKECEICGEYFTEDELDNGVCEDCVKHCEQCYVCDKWIDEGEIYDEICKDCLLKAAQDSEIICKMLENDDFAVCFSKRLKEVIQNEC